MNKTALHLPIRAAKPRHTGLTMVIDGGISLGQFTDLVSSAAEYVDFVKFGWGTAVVTNSLHAKIEVLNANEIGYYVGGTLFEKYVLQGRFDDFRKFCLEHSCQHVEEDLEAGASLVTLEARESGKSGICRPDGALRFGLIEDVLASGISPEKLLFEAPTTALQAHFVTRLGPDVNLGNVPAQGIIGLETLRLGLRADTLTAFE